MRNLKRALSLALAAAMLVSLMVVGASAAENYGDADAVSQTEAVEVLTAIGVVGGDQNGNFNPTATLTRAEFCVMIANALTGGTFDPALFDGTNTPFTDVAGHWGANYIAYCYSVGVIAGTSATTFSPDNTLTAAQASAILLMALGYNQNNEFGANGQFELNVIRWAQQSGLYDGLSVSATAGISRENTARLIFNALVNTTPVGYNTLSNAYYTLGTNVLNGIVLSGDDLDPVKDADGPNSAYEATLGYTNFDLTQTSATATDDFRRPAVQWQCPVAGVDTPIGTYAADAALTYTKEVSLGTIYNDLSLTATKAADVVDFVVNGDNTEASHRTNGSSGITLDTAALTRGDNTNKIGGNGVLTQVYTMQNGDVVISMVNTYIGDVVSEISASATAGRKIIIAGRNATAGTFETDDFAREDVVLYTYSEKTDAVETVALAEKVSGELTGYASNKSATVGGATYEYAATVNTTANGAELKIDVDVYLDQYGYAIDVEGVKAASEYAYLLKYSTSGGTFGLDNVARLLFADGTIEDVIVESAAQGTLDAAIGATDENVGIVSYTVNSDNEYTLTGVDSLAAVTDTKKLTVTKGASTVTLDNNTTAVTATANGETVFLVVTGTAAKPVYTAYTGIANVPSIKLTGDGDAKVYAYAVGSDGVADMIFVDARGADSISSDATEVVYIVGDNKSPEIKDADGEYYVYDAVIDGQITTIKVDDGLAETANGLTSGTNLVFKSVNYNDKGIVVSYGNAGLSGTGTQKEVNGTIGLDGKWYTYTDNCDVFYVEQNTENITVSSIGAIGNDTTDGVKYVTNSTGEVVAIFVEQVISGSNSVSGSGHNVYVNGVKATLTSESATGATITSAVSEGDIITFTPAISNMAAATVGLDASSTATGTVNAGTNSYTVVAGDTGSKTLVYNVTVTAENGDAAAAIQFTVTLPSALTPEA